MNSMLAIYFGQIHYSLAITACHAIISCLLFGKHYWAAYIYHFHHWVTSSQSLRSIYTSGSYHWERWCVVCAGALSPSIGKFAKYDWHIKGFWVFPKSVDIWYKFGSIKNFKNQTLLNKNHPGATVAHILQLWAISWTKEIRFTLWPDLMAFSDKSAEEELRLPVGEKYHNRRR